MGTYDRVKKFRKSFRTVALLTMGGECQMCGYNRCPEALELHHVDPSQKDFSFSKIRAWDRLYAELEKAILLCALCHREVHYKYAELPEEYTKFDRVFADSLRNEQSHNAERVQVNKESRASLVLGSGIDFSQKAWASKLSKLLNITSCNASKWVKSNMPDFYDKKCYKYKKVAYSPVTEYK